MKEKDKPTSEEDSDKQDLEEEKFDKQDLEEENFGSWEEKNFDERDFDKEDKDDDEKESEDFSIGDTILARGSSSDRWRSEGLEEVVFEDEAYDNYDEWEDEEDFGVGGFSYEEIGKRSSGDLYGAATSGASDLYGASSSGSNLYGTSSGGNDLYGVGQNSSTMYDTRNNNNKNESNLYITQTGKKNNSMNVSYDVGNQKKTKREKRPKAFSDLERGISRKKRNSGVSIL